MPNRLASDEEITASAAGAGYAALQERVDNQGRGLRALAEETSSQFRDVRADMSRNATELSAAIKGLDTKMDASAKTAADHARPQYAALIMGMLTAIGVAVGIIQWQTGLHDKPVDDKLMALATSIGDLTKATTSGFGEVSKNYISRSEYATAVDFRNKISDLTDKYNTQLRERMQAQIDKVESTEVGRAEHEVHWNSVAKRDSEIQGEIAQLNTRLDQLAPASDVIKRLTETEHELEMKVYGGSK